MTTTHNISDIRRRLMAKPGWSNTQKAHFVRACTAIGINDEQRRMILGQCEQRALNRGKITSTSPKLTNSDFDHCMAVVENMGNGQIQTKDRHVRYIFRPGHFGNTEETQCRRLRHVARHIVQHLFDGTVEDHETQLNGWIDGHVRGGKCRTLDQLTLDQLRDLCNGMNAYARRNHITISHSNTLPTRTSAATSPSTQGRNDAHQPLKPDQIPF